MHVSAPPIICEDCTYPLLDLLTLLLDLLDLLLDLLPALLQTHIPCKVNREPYLGHVVGTAQDTTTTEPQ